ncbi:MAG: hypothetical protein ACC651_17050 [Candidatus Scalindua sp.]
MSPVIRITPEVYSRLEKHAVGFDTPANVIEKLLNHFEGKENKQGAQYEKKQVFNGASKSNARLFTNREIQQKVSNIARQLSTTELDKLCEVTESNEIFGLGRFPLLLKVPNNTNEQKKRDIVKTKDGVNRWTWKFGFEKNGYLYAVCTQWYPKNDKLVQKWIDLYESE